MVLSKWKRRRSSRENQRTKFDNRVRVVVSSEDPHLINREVFVDEDSFVNRRSDGGWRYSIPIPKDHPIRKDSPHVIYKMRRGILSREIAMTLADLEASEMGYEITSPLKLPNDIE